MKEKLFFIAMFLLVLISCENLLDNNKNNDQDNLEYLSTVEELTALLPESLPLHPQAQTILPSAEGAEKIGGSRQYLNPDNNQTSVRIAITEYPQTEEDYDESWSYNVSFENEERKVTAAENEYPDVDVYEVLMKVTGQKFTTFYIEKRFEIYIESTGVADIQYHYDIAETLIDELKEI